MDAPARMHKDLKTRLSAGVQRSSLVEGRPLVPPDLGSYQTIRVRHVSVPSAKSMKGGEYGEGESASRQRTRSDGQTLDPGLRG